MPRSWAELLPFPFSLYINLPSFNFLDSPAIPVLPLPTLKATSTQSSTERVLSLLPTPPTPSIFSKELADLHEVTSVEVKGEPDEERNKWVVLSLYDAFNGGDVETVHRLLKPDLEWWFHGPPSHQHMMRVLTGNRDPFVFVPTSVAAFGSVVLVEGTDPQSKSSLFWVHAWTVGSDGIITQLREYFNTSLTVTRLSSSSSSESSCPPLWQSRAPVGASAGKTVPGLVLAI